MDANTVRTLTESLMSEHGLLAQGWTYKPSNAKSYAGQCRYGNKIIAISVTWAAHMADHEVRDTILHEIAHAIAGHSAKHSLKWKNLHRSIGGTGETRFKPTDATLSSFMGRPVKTATKAPVIGGFATLTILTKNSFLNEISRQRFRSRVSRTFNRDRKSVV